MRIAELFAEFKASGFERLSAQMSAMHSNAVKTGGALSAMGMHINAVGVGVRNMGLKVFAAGAAIVGPMIYAARSFAETGARLYDLSRRTGIAVEELSALDYVASQTGTSLEGVEIGLRVMSKSVLGAADAAEGTTGKLDHLGLSLKDLKGKSPIQQFNLIAERISAISDPTMRAAVALQMFGRSGTQLLPMLEKLDKLRGEAKEFGLIRTTESVRQAKAFSDAMTLMSRVIKSAWNAVGEAIVPVLQKAVKWITETVVKVRDWIKANPGLMESLLKIGAIVVGVGVGMAVLGMAIQTLAVPFAMLAGIVSVLSVSASIAVIVFKGMVGVLAFLTSPIGVAIVAVGALGAVILAETGAGSKALGWLGEKFSSLASDASLAFGGIAKALAEGNIGLAVKIVWTTIKMWWTEGVGAIKIVWNNAMLWIQDTFTTTWSGLKCIFTIIGNAIEVVWTETTSFLATAWEDVVLGLTEAWYWVAGRLAEAWGGLRIAFRAVVFGLKVVWIEFTSFLISAWDAVANKITLAWRWVAKELQKTWNRIREFIDPTFAGTAAMRNEEIDRQYEKGKESLYASAKDKGMDVEALRKKEREEAKKDLSDSVSGILEETNASKASYADRVKKAKELADAKKATIEEDRKASRKAQEEELAGKLSGISQGSADKRNALQKETDAANKAAKDAMDAARKEWDITLLGPLGPRNKKGGTGWDMGEWNDLWKNVPAVANATAAAGEEAKGGKGGKFMGFEDIWKTLQSAVLGGDSDKKVQKDQLTVQKEIRDELKKPKPARAG